MEKEKKIEAVEQAETVTFKTDDLMTYGILNYEGEELMAVISGYDLNIRFNMKLINSLADAESVADGMADVFYQALMEQLIAMNAEFIKPKPE